MQHHAYGIYGELAKTVPSATEFIEKTHGITASGNPDFEILKYDTFSIADARTFTARAVLVPIMGDTRVYIIAVKRMYNEAQNAILKLLEEPPSGSIIVIAIAYPTMLLQTVLSRLIPIPFDSELQTESAKEDKSLASIEEAVRTFLKSTQVERIAYVKEAFKKKTTKPHVLRDNNALFLDILEKSVYKKYKDTKDTSLKNTLWSALEDIETLRQYLYEKVTQARMLFEHLAIVIPIIKS